MGKGTLGECTFTEKHNCKYVTRTSHRAVCSALVVSVASRHLFHPRCWQPGSRSATPPFPGPRRLTGRPPYVFSRPPTLRLPRRTAPHRYPSNSQIGKPAITAVSLVRSVLHGLPACFAFLPLRVSFFLHLPTFDREPLLHSHTLAPYPSPSHPVPFLNPPLPLNRPQVPKSAAHPSSARMEAILGCFGPPSRGATGAWRVSESFDNICDLGR